jgi:multiple sugar transport system ATP-binding protein
MGEIGINGATKQFPNGVVAVDNVSIDIDDGEFVVLVGPSGCGKTTLLRLIAGLEDVSDGGIWIGGREVTRLPPKQRDIAMVFQNYALYPHMTVAENLGFALRLNRASRAEIAERVERVARILGLEPMLRRKPATLSGGQRQRVAIGRAMVREPAAFLMDEPLSNLDAKLRVQMRGELARLHERLRTTTVFVTHDQIEAMTLGDRVAVMRDGVLKQIDTPGRLYARPDNLFVASFIGSPSMNLFEATLEGDQLMFGGQRLPLVAGLLPGDWTGRRVIVGIRPPDLEDAEIAGRGRPTIDVKVDVVEELGAETQLLFSLDTDVPSSAITADDDAADEVMLVHDDAHDLQHVFTAQVDPSTTARPGSRIRLAVDPAKLYFFDPANGAALRAGRALAASA